MAVLHTVHPKIQCHVHDMHLEAPGLNPLDFLPLTLYRFLYKLFRLLFPVAKASSILGVNTPGNLFISAHVHPDSDVPSLALTPR